VVMKAIAQQALGALGNCFFCSGQQLRGTANDADGSFSSHSPFFAYCFPEFIQSTVILNQLSINIKNFSKGKLEEMAKKPWSPLRRLRTLQQLTQKELADALGVTQDTVANWERGRSVPRLTIPQFKTLLKVLQVTPEELPDDFSPPRTSSGDSSLTSPEDKEDN